MLREAGGGGGVRRYWLNLLGRARKAGARFRHGASGTSALAHGAPWAGLYTAPTHELLRRLVDRDLLDSASISSTTTDMERHGRWRFQTMRALLDALPFWPPDERLERREHFWTGFPTRLGSRGPDRICARALRTGISAPSGERLMRAAEMFRARETLVRPLDTRERWPRILHQRGPRAIEVLLNFRGA